jgi:hypothetical protein
MRRITFQIKRQVFKNEDWSYSQWQCWKLLQGK